MPSESPAPDADEVRQLAAARDLVLPDACIAGVVANLALLRSHAALLDDD